MFIMNVRSTTVELNAWKKKRHALSQQMSNKTNSLVLVACVCVVDFMSLQSDMWTFATDTFCSSIKIVMAFLFHIHIVYFITNETARIHNE